MTPFRFNRFALIALGAGLLAAPDSSAAQATATESRPAAAMDRSLDLRAMAAAEQRSHGTKPSIALIESFDGLGHGFVGPHGTAVLRNPSDNTLAVGPNHIVEIVNTRMAIYTKKGAMYDTTGKVLFGPVPTNVLFEGFGGRCEPRPNGDAVVRYDQFAKRWLYVMPIFRRDSSDVNEPYSMCYAVSVGEDPLGPFYRYEFKRKLFPDYPRPAIWPDGYYVPTSTGDHVIEKHACVVDRTKMLQGLPATEQCIIIPDVNFLNNADIDGLALPPAGAPNIMIAAGGSQLREDFNDDGIYAWKFYVDWETPSRTRVEGPQKIAVAPYNYLCNGQLTNCVPQPGTDRRLDAQGDKVMSRLVYRNIDGRESIIGLHSVNTSVGAGGVRWYEFRLDKDRNPYLYQQSTFAPDSAYRWMGSLAMDRVGNIGIGYSYGSATQYPGQRFAGRLADDPLNTLSFRETVLVAGEESQTNTLRWEDYTTTAMDPDDDCTIWYVGDYLKKGAPNYTTRIGAFRMPGCMRGNIRGSAFFDIDRDGYHDFGEPGLPEVRITYSGGESGTITTDIDGTFATSLPADPKYGSPTYSFVQASAVPNGWVQTARRNHERRSVTSRGSSFTIQLADRDEVRIQFGAACTATNTGGQLPAYWGTAAAEAMLNGRAPAWRRQISNTLHVVNSNGSRFTVGDSAANGLATFKAYMTSAPRANVGHAVSQQLAATALNVAYGKQDGNATVRDPLGTGWISINDLITNASAAIAANPSAKNLEKVRATLEAINKNSAEITPSSPAGCRS